MSTLIRTTEFLEENSNLLPLFMQKIEEYILDNRSVCICLSSSFMECRNTMIIDSYEINENYMSLFYGNFEVHINFDDATTITYEEDPEECFTITQNGMEFNLYFI